MAGMEAHESRKTVASRLNQLEKTQQKKTATGGSPHGNDKYTSGKMRSGKKDKMGMC